MKTVFMLLWPAVFAATLFAADAQSMRAQETRTIAVLEQALKTDPTNGDLWIHLGFAYRKSGDIDQAQKAFTQAATLSPQDPDSLYMLGLIAESTHQTADALRWWKKYVAVETDPAKKAVGENHIHHLTQ